MRTGRLGRAVAAVEAWLPLGAHEFTVLLLLLSGALVLMSFLH